MSKFYKTSFAFHQNFYNRNHISKGDLQNINLIQRKNKNLLKYYKPSDQDHINTEIKNNISKKIQIDPKLLFNHKSNISRNVNHHNHQVDKKIQMKLIKMNQTSKQRFYENNQRPQTKKSSRVRIWSAQKRRQVKEVSNRPHTSKCQRRVLYKGEISNKEYRGNILLNSRIRNRPHSLSGASTVKGTLQTSLDPQFLALFAN